MRDMRILLDMSQEVVNITTSEVAQLARVDTSTVRRWVERGTLTPSMKLPGGQYRFSRTDVERLLSPAPVDSPLTRESAGAFSRSAGDAA